MTALNQLTRVEAEEFRDSKRDAIDAIWLRCAQRGLRQIDLTPYIGSRGRVSETLNGKRALTLRMIRALHINLAIPLEHLCEVPKQ